MATSAGASPFPANWDFLHVTPDVSYVWQDLQNAGGTAPAQRHECSYVEVGDLFYLVGGCGVKPVNVFDPATGLWASAASPLFEMHYF